MVRMRFGGVGHCFVFVLHSPVFVARQIASSGRKRLREGWRARAIILREIALWSRIKSFELLQRYQKSKD